MITTKEQIITKLEELIDVIDADNDSDAKKLFNMLFLIWASSYSSDNLDCLVTHNLPYITNLAAALQKYKEEEHNAN